MNNRGEIETEKAFIVGVIRPGMTEIQIEEYLDELEMLAETAGAVVVGRFIQKLSKIHPKYFIGKGKAEQIIQQAKILEVHLIIFDDELSPSQVRNYLKLAKDIKIIDRTGLIIDVFTKHARTKEASSQVELAQLQYLLPRLTRMWTHLERQMGGIGTRAGAGETQIEVDRRIIRDRIAKLRKELEKIARQRETQGKTRQDKFRVALVGYTNAGKSTLMNSLTDAHAYVENQLFATLDTTVRSLNIDMKRKILLSDSVGFIRKLPHNLVASFRSTLKEILDADLLLILLDASSPCLDDHLSTVKEVLVEIGAQKTEYILVLNKIDMIKTPEIINSLKVRFPDAVLISALNHLRLDSLLTAVSKSMDKSYKSTTVVFDQSSGKAISSVYKKVEVLKSEYKRDKVKLTIRGHRNDVAKIIALSENRRIYEN